MSTIKRTAKRRRERWHQTYGLAVAKLLVVAPEYIHNHVSKLTQANLDTCEKAGLPRTMKHRKALHHAICMYKQGRLKFFNEPNPDGQTPTI